MLEQVTKDNEPDPEKRAAGVDNQMRQWKMEAMGDSTKKLKSTYLGPEGLAEAEILLCKNDQACYLERDLSRLSKGLPVLRQSSLYRLDPVLENGLIRVGGRLQRADIDYESKHQVILSGKSR